ncbi:helix-turn-helix transcriptional regulator [Pikeienuella sp. HZG-20]|uniref:helix-turn-helix transcriptional regulator n=1 Tax=Paludibacillus litoralis TaxID=3133267 RepID=UPI0030EE33A6
MTTSLTLDSIKRRLHAISHRGMAVGFSFQDDVPGERFYTYDQAWLNHYQTNGLVERDPTIIFGFSTNGVRSWRELEADGFDTYVFEEARKFGIENGTAFSLRVNGSKTIASVSHESAEMEEEAKLEVYSLLASGTVIVDSKRGAPTLRFDEEQKALIAYILQGRSDDEICKMLGIPARTFRYRRSSIIKQAGASSLPHLIHILHVHGVL